MIGLNTIDLEFLVGAACLASAVNAFGIRLHLRRALRQRELRRRWKTEAAAAAERTADVEDRARRLADMLLHAQQERAQLEISNGILRRQLDDALYDWPQMVRARLGSGGGPVGILDGSGVGTCPT